MSRNCTWCSAPLAAANAFSGGQRCRVCGKVVPRSEELCTSVVSAACAGMEANDRSREEYAVPDYRSDSVTDLQLTALLERSRLMAADSGNSFSAEAPASAIQGREEPDDSRPDPTVQCASLDELLLSFDEFRLQCRFTEILQLVEQYPSRSELQGLASRIMEIRYLLNRQESAWKSLGSSNEEADFDPDATEQYLNVLDEMQLVDEEFLAAMRRFRRPPAKGRRGSLFSGVRIPGSLAVGLITGVVYLCLPAMLESLSPSGSSGSGGRSREAGRQSEILADSDSAQAESAAGADRNERGNAAAGTPESEGSPGTMTTAQAAPQAKDTEQPGAASQPALLPGNSDRRAGSELRIRQVESEALQLAVDALAVQSGLTDGASGTAGLAMLAAQVGPIDGGLTQDQLALLLSGIQGGNVDCELIVPVINSPQQYGLSAADAALLQQSLQDSTWEAVEGFEQKPKSGGLRISCDLIDAMRETDPDYEYLGDLEGKLAEGTFKLAMQDARAGDYEQAFGTLRIAERTLGRSLLADQWLYIEALLVADTRGCLLQNDRSSAQRYVAVIRDWCPNREEDVYRGLPADLSSE